jgi:hypothetical protein
VEPIAKAPPAPVPLEAEQKIAKKPNVATPKANSKEASFGVGLVTFEDGPSTGSESGSGAGRFSSSWFGRMDGMGLFGSHTGFAGSKSSADVIYEP